MLAAYQKATYLSQELEGDSRLHSTASNRASSISRCSRQIMHLQAARNAGKLDYWAPGVQQWHIHCHMVPSNPVPRIVGDNARRRLLRNKSSDIKQLTRLDLVHHQGTCQMQKEKREPKFVAITSRTPGPISSKITPMFSSAARAALLRHIPAFPVCRLVSRYRNHLQCVHVRDLSPPPTNQPPPSTPLTPNKTHHRLHHAGRD